MESLSLEVTDSPNSIFASLGWSVSFSLDDGKRKKKEKEKKKEKTPYAGSMTSLPDRCSR